MVVKKRKLLKGTPQHLDLERRLGAAESDYLLLNVSGSCNYRCEKCCTSEDHDRRARKVSLTLDETEKIIGKAKMELGSRAVLMAGEGETLLAPNLDRIIGHIHGNGLTTILFTNASLLTKEKSEFFRDNDASLIISCDSLIPERYEKLVGIKGVFERTMKNITAAAEVYGNTLRKVSYNGREFELYRIAFNTIVSNSNWGEIDSIQKFCREHKIMSILNYPLIKGSILTHESELVGSVSNYRKQQALVFEKSENRGFSGVTSDEKCGYLFYGLSIGIDGSILAPCAYCPENEGLAGNIKDYLERPSGFIEAHRKVKNVIKEFAEHYGVNICLPRHEMYSLYLKRIGNK